MARQTWSTIYTSVKKRIHDMDTGTLFFRGHADARWPLLPSLARYKSAALARTGLETVGQLEGRFDLRFKTRSGELLRNQSDSWHRLFSMQHHGVPTRLLDWSRTFAVALHFALKNAQGTAAVWILDPYELNNESLRRASILAFDEIGGSYDEFYISKTKQVPGDIIALTPPATNPRVATQRAGFTLHDNLNVPLEKLHRRCVEKVSIPLSAQSAAREFLRLAGVSEFTLFPDLDGLARELIDELS